MRWPRLATLVGALLLTPACHRDGPKAPPHPSTTPTAQVPVFPSKAARDAAPAREADAGDDTLPPGTLEQQLALREASDALNAGASERALTAYLRAAGGAVTGTSISAALAATDLYEAQGNLSAARALVERVLREAPRVPEVQFTAARFFAGQRESARAIAGFAEAVALEPDFLPAYPLLAALLVQAGRQGEATPLLIRYESRLGRKLAQVRDERSPVSARLAVLDLLALLDDERVNRTLMLLLRTPRSEIRIGAAAAIADAPSPKGLLALQEAAASETEPFTRRVLAESLRRARGNVPTGAPRMPDEAQPEVTP